MDEKTSTNLEAGSPRPQHTEISKDDGGDSKHHEVLQVDLDSNIHAIKPDDSNGEILWSWRHIVASISLAGLYVGLILSFLRPLKHMWY